MAPMITTCFLEAMASKSLWSSLRQLGKPQLLMCCQRCLLSRFELGTTLMLGLRRLVELDFIFVQSAMV